ncbi:hypothetical protein OIN60_10620 [Paenibacillus sp. P96]|uniref:Uncharacterized protein n=1 Tax=Paenibacillus zeirhizosphaerae TaxID=2987519 RepID=A0ABT9FR57_9BACL|nr:hypothetical protein [Paenibacillus sp. P96]MDP4097223.1 hypothetical protein [Paenibacillus sp. P96]
MIKGVIPLLKRSYLICTALFILLILAGAWLNLRIHTGLTKGSTSLTDPYQVQIQSTGEIESTPVTDFRPREYIKIRRMQED